VSKIWESLLSIGLGGLGGTIVSVLLGPFSAWKQESVRRDRAARSEFLQEISSFKNQMLRELANRKHIEGGGRASVMTGIDFLQRIRNISLHLNNPDLNETIRTKIHRILSNIVGSGWVDYLKTCRLPEEIRDTAEAMRFVLHSPEGLIREEVLFNASDLSSEMIEKIIDKASCISCILGKSPGLLQIWRLYP